MSATDSKEGIHEQGSNSTSMGTKVTIGLATGAVLARIAASCAAAPLAVAATVVGLGTAVKKLFK